MTLTLVSCRWLGIRLEFFGNIIICSAALLAVLSRGSIEGAIVGLSISYALQVDIYRDNVSANLTYGKNCMMKTQ